MAGHRRSTGKPRRSVHRRAWWRTRIQGAVTSEQFADLSYDWLRAALNHMPDADRRTAILNQVGTYLSEIADELMAEKVA